VKAAKRTTYYCTLRAEENLKERQESIKLGRDNLRSLIDCKDSACFAFLALLNAFGGWKVQA